ncbi:DotA/TraY family protein [Stenotrophomonas maltophilia]|uniref:DotA/TraY family protein n=1 Tax=Stenotrophomonas maltophilia TaxID=40324 RepID=UPI001EF864BC|nr:DotA/TraY family protein [Stenotrophomonas maltophilia]
MIRLLAVLAALLIPTLANAQDQSKPGFFKPPADDTSVSFIRDVFGSIVDTIMSGENVDQASADTALAAGFEVFGLGILALGMLFVIFTTIKGAVDTAHDGEFLGKKMSSVWVPLRTAAGTAFLLPLQSGFSLIQIAVLWIAIHGVGLADRVWIATVDKMMETGQLGRPHLPDSRPLAANILRYEVCAAAMNKQYQAENRQLKIEVQPKKAVLVNSGEALKFDNIIYPGGWIDLVQSAAGSAFIVTGLQWSAVGTGGYMNPNVCGALEWQESHESSESNGSPYIDKTPILRAQAQAVQTMIGELRPIAQAIVNGEKPSAGGLERAANNYETTLQGAALGVVNQANRNRNTRFLSYAREGGWIFAGTYYNHIIHMSDAIQSAVNSLPASSAQTITDKEAADTLILYQDSLVTANEYIRNSSQSAYRAYEAQNQAVGFTGDKIPSNFEEMKVWLSRPALAGINQLTQEIAGSNLSHVAQMKNVGDTIMAVAWTIQGAQFIVAGFGGGLWDDAVTFGAYDIGASIETLTPSVAFLFMTLLAAGAFLAFYVPMIPYIIWITGIIKWLTVLFESVIAAPIWGAAHVHPDGDDQVGRAGPGYMIILSVFLRPTLMIFGLLGSIVVAQPVAHFVNLTYITQVQGAMGNSANAIGALIAYTAIYAILMTIVLHSVFGFINWIPDNVLRWIGSAVGMHGIADSEEHGVKGAFFRSTESVSKGTGPHKPAGGGGDRKPVPGGGSEADPGAGSGVSGGSGNDVHSTNLPGA